MELILSCRDCPGVYAPPRGSCSQIMSCCSTDSVAEKPDSDDVVLDAKSVLKLDQWTLSAEKADGNCEDEDGNYVGHDEDAEENDDDAPDRVRHEIAAKVADRLATQAGQSFYVHTQGELLYYGLTWYTGTMFFLSVIAMFFQLMSVLAVISLSEIDTWWEDDKIFGGGRDGSTNYNRVYEHMLFGIPICQAPVLLICSALVSVSCSTEIKEITVGWCLICDVPAWLVQSCGLARMSGVSAADGGHRGDMAGKAGRSLAYVMHVMRAIVIVCFVEATVELLGTSNGGFDTILNSLALVFILVRG